MDEFLKALETLKDRKDLLQEKSDNDFRRYYNSTFKEVRNVESLACKYLIDMHGGCNWVNISELRKCGYRVFKGEGDSFGWLVGCIVIETVHGTPHVLVYG